MFGLRKENDLYIFEAVVHTEQLYLDLYDGSKKVRQIAFDPGKRIGDVWKLEVAEDISKYSYCYEADGHIFTDPNGTVFEGRKKFGFLKDGIRILKTPVAEAVAMTELSEEWLKDRPLEIPYDESVIYRLHVRGFTAHSSSGLNTDVRGTFQGIIEKIPYLTSLGITAVELMPPYEFNEVMLPDFGVQNPYKTELKPTGRINYWGFTKDALQLAPKSSFTSDHKNPRNEFRKMVYELHRNNIEVIVDLYFTYETLPDYITTVMRYWRINYHVDGIHMIGSAPYSVIARDPYLSRFKIWADSWEGQIIDGDRYGGAYRQNTPKYLADYNDGFQNDMRRVLKGDESMLGTLMNRIRFNPADRANIQYMANVSGMSLMDSISYDRKHNESNYEDNRDGTNQNFSWNCGEEGPSRKKSVKLLRKKMWRNAYLLLMLCQGTPLINSGDECGQTRLGNNNAYCQDNNLNWMNWHLMEKNQELYEFARYVISFRKKHKVFHQPTALKQLDYRSVGIPDLSFHGENAWRPEMDNYRRQLGVMYAGEYAQDETFMVLYNFHWEKHDFLLAHPPAGKKWAIAIDTASEDNNGIYPEGQELELSDNEWVVEPRSIVVLKAVKDKSYKPKRRRVRKQKTEDNKA
ncbi:alpha-amylase family glycosyl hydrolase [Oribacterium sp. WCC10]|uniref:alpha-amylase family glycosyl hydrolase n=1 Tax=Oribacterium sp. WCC10 TaxID=1855343 RepID=UPI0008E2C040|nr:alpha-amylase family glycosyl hydrolase [Oribacterium sp. WCC10]SFG13597.1 glycogen operon protein [Oribacterium sp. WCC10]